VEEWYLSTPIWGLASSTGGGVFLSGGGEVQFLTGKKDWRICKGKIQVIYIHQWSLGIIVELGCVPHCSGKYS